MMDNGLLLLPELEPFREQIYATQKSVMRLIPQPAADTLPWQTKIGGHPYLPKGVDFPVNAEGQHLFFLAQINFAEAPHLAPFPESGILQFFISDDDFFGQNLDDPFAQQAFRVVYFAEITENPDALITDFSFLRAYQYLPLPANTSFPIAFHPDVELMPVEDWRFEGTFGTGFFEQFGDQEWEVYEEYVDLTLAEGHKYGGYPDFAQEDPRSPENPLELLFQLDSDEAIQCQWGDMGVANFFIHPDALAKCDFSRVLYNWDTC
ncbi:MAG TPA: DUF1963 domain-containing protein [Saprospiraceae bacterium]|nr:DUF1963 domain-containing protein [Saprospiraceae bacterium]HMP23574.1 DUF1963 domain-containing protein [Saprospiraceae bacterium]